MSLTLDLVTQEARLLTTPVRQLTVVTATGELTLLPGHTPLVTRLAEGLLRYVTDQGVTEVVAIFGGFLELDKTGLCSILADSAIRADDIDIAKVQAAEQEARRALSDKSREQEFALAESALRHAALELKAAKHKIHRSS